MSNYVTAIGLDVHARSIKACALNPMTGEVERAVSVNLFFTSWDCGGNPGPKPSYAARPKSLRYCMGLL